MQSCGPCCTLPIQALPPLGLHLASTSQLAAHSQLVQSASPQDIRVTAATTACTVMQVSGAIDELQLEEVRLLSFLRRVEAGYMDVPYHNR